jgi:short-subunit dehydrogenase
MPRFRRPAEGSIAVVTGASAGIGRGFARELARRGHPVLAIARRAERLRALADQVAADGGARVEPLAIDVTADDAPARIAAAARAMGRVGWLVNNAGSATFGWFGDGGIDRERALVRLNCDAVAAITAAVLPLLLHERAGIALHVASSAAFQPTPGWATYGATKAFVLSLGEALAEELRGTGVLATVLCPGPVATDIFDASGVASQRRRPPHELTVDEVVRTAIARALRGRVVIVPGGTNRVVALASKLSPRAIVRRVSAKTSLRFIGLPPLPPRP